jgi:hypothetical protein
MRLKLSELLDEALEAKPRFANRNELRSWIDVVHGENGMPGKIAVVIDDISLPITVVVANHSDDEAIFAIMIRTPGTSFRLEDEETIIGDEPSIILYAEFEPPLDERHAKKPIELVRLARRLAAPSIPTVENGTPESFSAAYRMLLAEIKRIDGSKSLNPKCAWALEPNIMIPGKIIAPDPTEPLLIHAKPTHFLIHSEGPNKPSKARRATVAEFVGKFKESEASAHDRIAAEDLLIEAAARFADDPMTAHPAWAKFAR